MTHSIRKLSNLSINLFLDECSTHPFKDYILFLANILFQKINFNICVHSYIQIQ